MLKRDEYLSLAFTALLLLASHAHAAQPLGCLIEPDRIAEVGSQVIGIAETIHVERGDYVKKGQILATLRADVERASVQVANSRSDAIAEVRSAEANLKLAQATEHRQAYLLQKKFVSQQAVDKAHAETAIAKEKLALAKEQLNINQGELSLARAQLNQRVIRSPIDGIIADRYIWPGERIEDKPLFRVAKIHPLRVEIVMPATLFGTVSQDSMIQVMPQLPNAKALDAKVVLVDKLIDGASNTFRIRAQIPNEAFEIPSGLRCKVTLAPAQTQDNTSSVAPPTATSGNTEQPIAVKTFTMDKQLRHSDTTSKTATPTTKKTP